jgi:spermidine synthase
MMTKEFYQLVRSRLAPHGVAAFNILPGEKLFDSNVRTLKIVFDQVDFFGAGERSIDLESVVAIGRLDPLTEAEAAQRAQAAQARYNFRFDVARLLKARRMDTPKAPKGDILTDDFAPANVLDAYGRRYRRQKQPDGAASSPQ